MTLDDMSPVAPPAPPTTRSWSTADRAMTVLAAVLLAVPLVTALAGPFLAPEAAPGNAALDPPGGQFPLGTDTLGRDLLGLLLTGGTSVVLLTVGCLLLTSAVGVPLGLFLAATTRRWLDGAVLRTLDVLSVLPALLILLVFAATGRRGVVWLVVAIALAQLPSVVRLARSAASAPACRTALEAMAMVGEPWWRIHLVETGRRVAAPVVVDAGTRVVLVVALVTTANFLGVGLPASSPDWAVVVEQNISALFLAPLTVLLPVALLVSLCVGTNLLVDRLLDRGGDPS